MKNLLFCNFLLFLTLSSYSQTTWQVCVEDPPSTTCAGKTGTFTPGNLVIQQGDMIQFTTTMVLLGGYTGTFHDIQFTGSPANNVMLQVSSDLFNQVTTVTTPPFNTPGVFPMECVDFFHCLLSEYSCTGYSVTVLPSCSANSNFTASSLNVCTGQPVNFTNTSTGATSYTWHLDEVTFATSTNASLNFSTAGSYDIELIANGGVGCLDSNTITINVSQAADAGLDAAQTYCNDADSVNLNTLLTATLGGAWSETTTSNQFNNTTGYFDYTMLTAGAYFFNYVIAGTGACLNDTAEVVITINQSPEIILNVSPNLVDLVDSVFIDFTANGVLPGATYLWSFCDGNNQTNNTPFYYSWESTGLFCVCLTVNNGNGCANSFCDSSMVVFDASGIYEAQAGRFKIYPNPTKDFFNIDLTSVSSILTIKIYDETSRLISEENVNGGGIQEIKINQLKKGIYFVQIVAENESTILPLVVE